MKILISISAVPNDLNLVWSSELLIFARNFRFGCLVATIASDQGEQGLSGGQPAKVGDL